MLADLHFKPIMDSSDNNISEEFLVPALSQSVRYDRGVGFFSSGWLVMVVEGMTQFAANGGKARIITSPILNQKDWDAMQEGAEARFDEILYASLHETIKDLQSTLSADVRTALSWLIADRIIEFKIAIPQKKLTGEFHAKFGVFTDEEGNQISFNGSNNETIHGTQENWEYLHIFSSWEPAYKAQITAAVKKFERLWNNEDPNLRLYNLPEAARQKIIKIREPYDERPYQKPRFIREYYASYETRQLWEHQLEAIQAWEDHDRHGILAMATGSGKTRTALAAAESCPELAVLLIAVPRNNLVDQWAEELTKYTSLPKPICVYEKSADWQDLLFNKFLAGHQTQWQKPLVMIGSMQSLSGSRFLSILEDGQLPPKSLIIVDEAHNVGAPSYQKILRAEFEWRLGLSAIPERPGDEEGNQAILDYFGGTVYEYSMADALRDERLCPYDYHVYPAYMSEDEFESYQQLTQKIIRLRSNIDAGDNKYRDEKDLEQLFFQRASLIKKVSEKEEIINDILDDFPPQRCLIYCADTEQLNEISGMLNERELIHQKYISKTPAVERAAALEAIGAKRVPVLLAIDCLDEGIDVPAVDQAIILASSKNRRQFIQRRGRVLRKSPDKQKATMIDVIVLPPYNYSLSGNNAILCGELLRATEIAELADNHHSALLQIDELVSPYGILLTELLSWRERQS